MPLPDDLWQVIKETVERYKGVTVSDEARAKVEQLQIELFDGGAFVSSGGPEFDVFVLPNRRGKWAIRRIGNDYLRRVIEKHGRAVVRVDARNKASLRLALGFGFVPVERNGSVIKLEINHG